MYRSRLFTVVTFAGVLAVGAAAASQCGPDYSTITLPTTTTTTRPTTTTTTTPIAPSMPPWDAGASLAMLSVMPDGSAPSYPVRSFTSPGSGAAAISADGRYVVFRSDTALVPGAGIGEAIYGRDLVTGAIQRLVTLGGLAGSMSEASLFVSDDGRFVTFSYGTGIYLLDRTTGTTELVSVNADGSPDTGVLPEISPVSADGRYVAFVSQGSGLVGNDTDPGPTTDPNSPAPWKYDVYVRDRVTGTNELISKSYDGSGADGETPSMTPDGRYIAFTSRSPLLPGDANDGCMDTYVYDRVDDTMREVSVTNDGSPDQFTDCDSNLTEMPTAISADGSTVAFQSLASNLYTGPYPGRHLYVRDLVDGTTQLVDNDTTPINDHSPSVSADGGKISYTNYSTGLNNDGVWLFDRATGNHTRIPLVPSDGVTISNKRALSADASHIVFTSTATNLVSPPDLKGGYNVYIERIG